jgi:hypothetical protein
MKVAYRFLGQAVAIAHAFFQLPSGCFRPILTHLENFEARRATTFHKDSLRVWPQNLASVSGLSFVPVVDQPFSWRTEARRIRRSPQSDRDDRGRCARQSVLQH